MEEQDPINMEEAQDPINMEEAQDVEGGEGGEDGNDDMIPIFLKTPEGGLQLVAHLSRLDCVDMGDFHDAMFLVDDIVAAAGIELPDDHFSDFEIPLLLNYLDGEYFKVPYNFADTLEAVTRVVINHYPFDQPEQGEQSDLGEVSEAEVE